MHGATFLLSQCATDSCSVDVWKLTHAHCSGSRITTCVELPKIADTWLGNCLAWVTDWLLPELKDPPPVIKPGQAHQLLHAPLARHGELQQMGYRLINKPNTVSALAPLTKLISKQVHSFVLDFPVRK